MRTEPDRERQADEGGTAEAERTGPREQRDGGQRAGQAREVPGHARPEEEVRGRRHPGGEDREEREALAERAGESPGERDLGRGQDRPHGEDRAPRVVAEDGRGGAVEPERDRAVAPAQVAEERVRGEPVPGARLLARGAQELRLVAREGREADVREAEREERQRRGDQDRTDGAGHALAGAPRGMRRFRDGRARMKPWIFALTDAA
jgi:hypothetical protein